LGTLFFWRGVRPATSILLRETLNPLLLLLWLQAVGTSEKKDCLANIGKFQHNHQ
jgi:hypothetical protein